MTLKPALLADFYKLSHTKQFPAGTQFVYSNTTARSSRIEGVDSVVVFGMQYLIKEYLIDLWNKEFFNRPKEEVIHEFARIVNHTVGEQTVNIDLFSELHDLGYLPVHIKCLPEGTRCPIQVPFMTIKNTDPKFFWVTNFLETLIQTCLWQGIVSATIADRYKQLMTAYAEETSSCPGFVPFAGHDFSMRGMSSVETGAISGAAHLTSFLGTDTISGIMFLEKYYNANVETELVGTSVPATEHAVTCAGSSINDDLFEGEVALFKRLITEVYPSGIVSLVSDTWDFWRVISEILPTLYDDIMARDGKVVIRPDSGDPVKIVTGYFPVDVNMSSDDIRTMKTSLNTELKLWDGDHDAIRTTDGVYFDKNHGILTEAEVKGAIVSLYNIFGGVVNDKGYKELDSHIGLIYGDSITFERCEEICQRLKAKGFASTNLVYGIGSYTYQYNTRDTFSIACKATWVQINDKPIEIFKDPQTGSSKKSAKGLLCVNEVDGKLSVKECCTPEEESSGLLQTVFINGQPMNEQSLSDIRKRLSVKP